MSTVGEAVAQAQESPQLGKPKRKLTTVMATDCVNFSFHMQLDEEATYRNLRQCRVVIDQIIETHDGRIFHTAGDSVIAEFVSPIDAINASVAFQKALGARNADAATELGLEWRVGIHLDDVIVEGSNIMGCGVNIAARLESHCAPGQILTSRAVQERTIGRTAVAMTAAGTRALKNISENFEVFSIDPNGDAVSKQSASHSREVPQTAQPALVQIEEKTPRIAVFPFENMSRHEDSEYLVEGLFRDLITEFSRMQQFDVLSHKTTLDFRESSETLDGFAKSMGVDYYVSGTVRVAGSKLRITVDLADASTGETIWGEKYDRLLDDIFDIQDEIVLKMSRQVLGSIEVDTLRRIKRKPSEKLNSYEWLIRGNYHHVRFGQDHMSQAIEAFDKAIEIDGANGRAHALKACTIGGGIANGWLKREEAFPEVQYHLKKSLEADEEDFDCQRISSALSLMSGDKLVSLEHAQRAHQINPNDPRVLRQLAATLIAMGRAGEAIKHLNHAFDLDPIPQGKSTSCDVYKGFIVAYFSMEDDDSCILYGEKIVRYDAISWLLVVAAYARKFGKEALASFSVFKNHAEQFATADWASAIDLRAPWLDKASGAALPGHVTEILGR